MDRVGCRALAVLAVLMLTGASAATVRVTTEETRLPGDRCRRHCAEKLDATGDVGGSDCPGGEQCRRCIEACEMLHKDRLIRTLTAGSTAAERSRVSTDGHATGSQLGTDEVGWCPRITGMTFSSALVMASVTWPAHGSSQYLITWELQSGGVRGHLVCSETTASLPLWPDQQYLVQVFYDGGASRPLRIDTHRSGAAVETSSGTHPTTHSEDVYENVPDESAEKSWSSATTSSGGASASSFARVPDLVRRISEMAAVAVPVAAALGVERVGPVAVDRGKAGSDMMPADTALPAASGDHGPAASPATASVGPEAGQLSLPLLSLLVALPLLLLLMMMGAAALRQTSAEVDQQVLLGPPASSWRPRTLPRALGDRNCEPSFIIPTHKR